MKLILFNGRIHSLDKNNNMYKAVAIDGGRIVALGAEEILNLKTDETELIDLEGKAVYPGFHDSHMHLLNYGYALTMANLNSTESIEDLQRRMKSFLEGKPKGSWIRGRGWNHDYFSGEKRFPNRYDLDEVSTEYPLVVTRTCGHVLTVNSKALELLGIRKGAQSPPGGSIDLDENDEPTGVFREEALGIVYSNIPTPSLEEVKAMMMVAFKNLNKEGITSVGSDDFGALPGCDYNLVIEAFVQLAKENEMTVRVNEQCLIPDIGEYKDFIEKGYSTGWGNELFKIGPLKLLLDGSLGARTAALNAGYEDNKEQKGIVTMSQKELDAIVELAHTNNNQIAIHGIGDRAMYMAFEAIEKSQKQYRREDARHGIVHAQITDNYLLNRFKELDAIAYAQPIFIDYDWKIVEQRVGNERMKSSYNWKTMLDMGIHTPYGSDAPVETFSVMAGIYEAVTRKDLKGNPTEGWLPEQAVTVDQALKCYTKEGAYSTFEEDIKGLIEVGKLADMVCLKEDINEIDINLIKDVEVAFTVFGGKVLK